MRDYKQAQAEVRPTIRLRPDFARAHWLVASIALEQKGYRQGMKAIAHALELNSNESLFHATRAALLLNSGKVPQALKSANEALSLAPQDGYAQGFGRLH